jgi:alkaline phosphatase D
MLQARGAASDGSEASGPFAHGVASGDPDHESLVIWTRVSGLSESSPVRWKMASDAQFESIVAEGHTLASADRDYIVKVLVAGLAPGHRYYYRFEYGGAISSTGRTRTLPAGDLESLTLAVASCSNYPFGYFNAYEAIAEDADVDWVLHLGDYIYEYGTDGYGGSSGGLLGRDHTPRHEILTLADYRQRHAQYKGDPQSQRMHAAHPLLAIWDDHEATNNPWMGGAENHQAESEGSWSARRDAALQAYFEWMPVRDPFPGQSRRNYWRHWRFGNLASLISLETRHSGRDRQIEYSAYESMLRDQAGAERFLKEVVGAPDRPMLSSSMESFLAASLEDAVAAERPWKLIANQVPMARTNHPRLSDEATIGLRESTDSESLPRLERMLRSGQLELPLYLDPWDGYPVARQAFYELCASTGVKDLLVLTGDSHSFWSNELFDDSGRPMGIELGTTGITSPGDFLEFGPAGAKLMDEALADTNREVLWTDSRHNGFLKVTLNRSGGVAEYLAVDRITAPSYALQTLRSVEFHKAGGTLSYAR